MNYRSGTKEARNDPRETPALVEIKEVIQVVLFGLRSLEEGATMHVHNDFFLHCIIFQSVFAFRVKMI